jgi:hypothetical protein
MKEVHRGADLAMTGDGRMRDCELAGKARLASWVFRAAGGA